MSGQLLIVPRTIGSVAWERSRTMADEPRNWEYDIDEALDKTPGIADVTDSNWDVSEGRYSAEATLSSDGGDPDEIERHLRGLLPDCDVVVHGPDEDGLISIQVDVPDDE